MSVVDTKIPKLGILSDVAGRVADCDSDISELKWQPIAVGGAAALCEVAQSCRALCDPTDCSPPKARLCRGLSRQEHWTVGERQRRGQYEVVPGL